MIQGTKVTKAVLKVTIHSWSTDLIEECDVLKYLEETILTVSAWMLIYFFYPTGSQLLQLTFWAIPFSMIYTAVLMIVVKRKRGSSTSQ